MARKKMMVMMKATKRSLDVSYAIRDILLPARELEKKGAEIIKLHIGDPNKYDFETPKHVRDALCRAVEVNDNGYAESEGYVELRQAILEKEKQKNNIDVDIDNCVITNGVTEAIQMISAAVVNPGDQVLMVTVTHSIEEAVFLGDSIMVLGGRPCGLKALIPNPGAGACDYRNKEEFFDVCRQVRRAVEAL